MESLGKILFVYKDRIFLIDDEVYPPEKYSMFFAEHLLVKPGDRVLDLTTGSGFHAVIAASKASHVTAIDINSKSVKCARRNSHVNRLEDKIDVRQGDMFGALRPNEQFDVIISWPPIFPTPSDEKTNDWYVIATEGGKNGRKFIDRIIKTAPAYLAKGGRLQLLHAWYNDVPQSCKLMEAEGFSGVEITAEDYFPVGRLSGEKADYLRSIGFPLIERDGELVQKHSVVTGWWQGRAN